MKKEHKREAEELHGSTPQIAMEKEELSKVLERKV